MPARLKVYQARLDGVNDWVVAAPNQRAALEAWGVHRNLFADGEAGVTTDDAAVSAAIAQPGVPVRRPHGGRGAFAAARGSDASGWSAAAKAVGAKKTAAKKPKVDRSKMEAAEKALAAFETDAERRLAELGKRREALEREEREARQEIADQRRALEAGLISARHL